MSHQTIAVETSLARPCQQYNCSYSGSEVASTRWSSSWRRKGRSWLGLILRSRREDQSYRGELSTFNQHFRDWRSAQIETQSLVGSWLYSAAGRCYKYLKIPLHYCKHLMCLSVAFFSIYQDPLYHENIEYLQVGEHSYSYLVFTSGTRTSWPRSPRRTWRCPPPWRPPPWCWPSSWSPSSSTWRPHPSWPTSSATSSVIETGGWGEVVSGSREDLSSLAYNWHMPRWPHLPHTFYSDSLNHWLLSA